MDYWEEVTAGDGSVYFYNHISKESSWSLPTNESYGKGASDANDANDAHGGSYANDGNDVVTSTDERQGQTTINDGHAAAGESINEVDLASQVWDGVDGEVFIPWPEEEPQAMKTSPESTLQSDQQLETPGGEKYDAAPSPLK